MSFRSALVILLALVCGLSAAAGVNRLRQSPDATPSGVETCPVVVSVVDIPRGVMISADHLTVKAWPAEMVPPGALSKVEDAVDKVPRTGMVKGEPVIDVKIADGIGGLVSNLIPEGMRAFTIHTPTVASGVAGLVQPGDNVDIVLTVSRAAIKDHTGGGSATTLLQNIEVLAVDQDVETQADRKVDRNGLRSVTLIVTQDQANKLSLAQSKGTLHLSLRRPGDDVDSNTVPVTFNDIRMLNEPVAVKAETSESAAKETVVVAPRKPKTRIRTLRGRVRGYVYTNQ